MTEKELFKCLKKDFTCPEKIKVLFDFLEESLTELDEEELSELKNLILENDFIYEYNDHSYVIITEDEIFDYNESQKEDFLNFECTIFPKELIEYVDIDKFLLDNNKLFNLDFETTIDNEVYVLQQLY